MHSNTRAAAIEALENYTTALQEIMEGLDYSGHYTNPLPGLINECARLNEQLIDRILNQAEPEQAVA